MNKTTTKLVRPAIETNRINLPSRLLALEPRYVFDAALGHEVLDSISGVAESGEFGTWDQAASTAADIVAAGHAQDGLDRDGGLSGAGLDTDGQVGVLLDALVTAHNLSAEGREIAFIDTRLNDLPGIVNAIPEGVRIVFVDSSRDGVQQMADALSRESGITGIHIISHGSAGSIQLGSSVLNAETMSTLYADALGSFQAHLTEGADILVYGCNFGAGEAGEEAAAILANLTGADIASSDDLTGAEALGGDWDLERNNGFVETRVLSAPDWDSTLAPLVISVSGQPTVTGATGTDPNNGNLPSGPAGMTAVWVNAGTIGGTPIDVKATLLSLSTGTASFNTSGDDLSFWLNSSGATGVVRWEIFASGTNQTVYAVGSPNIQITDIDGTGGVPNSREVVRPQLGGLTSYTLESPTNLVASTSAAGVNVSGTQNQTQNPPIPISMAGFTWQEVSSWTVEYQIIGSTINANFRHDGDGDFVFVAPNTTTLLALDLDSNNSTATGTSYLATYTENGPGVPVVDADRVITQNAVLGTTLGEATVKLTNAQGGDVLSVGTLPGGITASVDTSVAGEITVTLSGSTSVANYQAALSAITFSNSTDTPSTVNRNIEVNVRNTTFGTTSNTAISTIQVTAVNDPPVATPSTSSGDEDTNIPVDLTGTDVDGTVDFVTVTSLPPATQGILYMPDGVTPVTANTPISATDAANLVFVPATNFNGTVTIPFTVTDDDGTTSAPANEVITVNDVNDPPVANNDSVTVQPGVLTSVTVLGNDTDADGDALSVSQINGTNVAVGATVTLASGTQVTRNADGTLGVVMAHGSSLSETFTYTISDGAGGTSTATVTLNRDTDGDGVANATDIDDDNDGILDTVEGLVVTSATGEFATFPALSVSPTNFVPKSGTATGGSFASGSTTSATVTVTNVRGASAGGNQTNVTFFDVGNGNGGEVDIRFSNITDTTLPRQVVNSGFLIKDIDAPHVEFTLQVFDAAGNIVTNASNFSVRVGSSAGPTTLSAPVDLGGGSFRYSLDSLHFASTLLNINGANGTVLSGMHFTLNSSNVTGDQLGFWATRTLATFGGGDSDGDGKIDSLDIDSDNDGITDNVEAQTTAGYVAPSGTSAAMTDVDGDGLDDVYDQNLSGAAGSVGILPVDTDGDAITDKLDLNSDEIGANDIVERGDGQATSITSTADTDGDGLLDIFEGTDINDGFDVNDENLTGTTFNLADTDDDIPGNGAGATPLTRDFDYRDAASPVIDLNSAASPTETNRDFANTYTENDLAVSVVSPTLAGVTSQGEADLSGVSITLASAAPDGANEIISIGGVNIALNANGSGSSSGISFSYIASTRTILFERNGLAMADGTMQALLRTITYRNTSENPTAGDRVFTFRATDLAGNVSDPAVSTITVTPVNDPPVATPSTSSGNEDTNIPVDLTGTDVDGTVDFVTVTTLPPAAQGVLYLPDGVTPVTANTPISAADAGNLVFIPATNFNGTVTIPFTVTDNDGTTSAPANEVITVNDVNDPPVATPSTSSGNEDTNIPVDLTGTDVDGTVDFVTVTSLPPAAQGILYMPDGVTPVTANTPISATDAANLVFVPATNFNGTVTIPFTVTDNDGGVSTPANEVITVNPVNDAPVAVNDVYTVAEDSSVSGDLVWGDVMTGGGADSDPDGDALTVTQVEIGGTVYAIDPMNATAIVIPNVGTLTLYGAGGFFDFLPVPNFNGSVPQATYTITDGNGGTSSATLDITVTPVYDPVNALYSVVYTLEDTPITNRPMDVVNADGAALTYTLGSFTPEHGSVTINADGTFTYTPEADYTGMYGSSATDRFTYIVSDGTTSIEQMVTVDIRPVNDEPAGADKTVTLKEDTTYRFSTSDFGFADAAADQWQNHLFKEVIITTLPTTGTLTYAGGAVSAGQAIPSGNIALLEFIPAANSSGTPASSFTFQVVDDGGSNLSNHVVNGSLENTTFGAVTTDIPAYESTTPPPAALLNPAGLEGWTRVLTQWNDGVDTLYMLEGTRLETDANRIRWAPGPPGQRQKIAFGRQKPQTRRVGSGNPELRGRGRHSRAACQIGPA